MVQATRNYTADSFFLEQIGKYCNALNVDYSWEKSQKNLWCNILLLICYTCRALKNKTCTGQCLRCRTFGHSQYKCTVSYKCVKCVEDHPSWECLKAMCEVVKCYNCGTHHPASSTSCLQGEQSKLKAWTTSPLVEDRNVTVKCCNCGTHYSTSCRSCSQDEQPKLKAWTTISSPLLSWRQKCPFSNSELLITAISKTICGNKLAKTRNNNVKKMLVEFGNTNASEVAFPRERVAWIIYASMVMIRKKTNMVKIYLLKRARSRVLYARTWIIFSF